MRECYPAKPGIWLPSRGTGEAAGKPGLATAYNRARPGGTHPHPNPRGALRMCTPRRSPSQKEAPQRRGTRSKEEAEHPDGHRTQQNGHQAERPRPRVRCRWRHALSVSLPVCLGQWPPGSPPRPVGLQVSLLIWPEEAPQNTQRMCRRGWSSCREKRGGHCSDFGRHHREGSAGFSSRPLFLSVPSPPGWQTYFSIL